jgi:alkylhydroperoxidase family enzyme
MINNDTKSGNQRIPALDHYQFPPLLQSMAKTRSFREPLPRLYRTLGHHPFALERFMPYHTYITPATLGRPANGNEVHGRHREIVVLRIGWNCGSVYLWEQHVEVARQEGMLEEEIMAVARGPEGTEKSTTDEAETYSFESSSVENLLMQTVDELCFEHMVSEATWSGLMVAGKKYGDSSLRWVMDVIMTTGNYMLVSMCLNGLSITVLDESNPQTPPATDTPTDYNPETKRFFATRKGSDRSDFISKRRRLQRIWLGSLPGNLTSLPV